MEKYSESERPGFDHIPMRLVDRGREDRSLDEILTIAADSIIDP